MGSAPDPTGGAYSAFPDPIAGGEGARCPLPENRTPSLDPLGLGFLFSLYLSIHGLRKKSWKISHGGPGKVLDFLSVKEWEPWL